MELEYKRRGPDHIVLTDAHIFFQFSRMHEGHDGEVIGMLRIFLLGFPGEKDRDLYDGKIILTGPQSKAGAARQCATRCAGFTGWPELVDEACKKVRRVIADGEPFIDLADGEPEAEAPYLLRPLWRLDEHGVLFGAGGTAKSTLCLAWAMALTNGSEHWALQVGEPQTVGYLDFEDSEANFRRRLGALATGMGIARPTVWYKRGEASLAGMADSLSRQCADLGITGLVIDHAAMACGTEPESAEAANSYFRALRSLPISWSWTIAHQPKDKERAMDPYGSVFWRNLSARISKERSRRSSLKAAKLGSCASFVRRLKNSLAGLSQPGRRKNVSASATRASNDLWSCSSTSRSSSLWPHAKASVPGHCCQPSSKTTRASFGRWALCNSRLPAR